MSKVKNGNYGTFTSAGVRAAVKEHCLRKGMKQKYFFLNFFGEGVALHNSEWWRSACADGYGDETELRLVCRAVGYDFQKLNFKAKDVNDKVLKNREAAKRRDKKKTETKSAKQETKPVQMKITDFIQGTPSQDKKILEIWREVERLGYEKSMAVADMAKAARSLGLL